MVLKKIITGTAAIPLIILAVLQVPPERFTVTTSPDMAIINKAYPYFRIKFDINE
jgi:hypothetical protein